MNTYEVTSFPDGKSVRSVRKITADKFTMEGLIAKFFVDEELVAVAYNSASVENILYRLVN